MVDSENIELNITVSDSEIITGPSEQGDGGSKGGLASPTFWLLIFFINNDNKKKLKNVQF